MDTALWCFALFARHVIVSMQMTLNDVGKFDQWQTTTKRVQFGHVLYAALRTLGDYTCLPTYLHPTQPAYSHPTPFPAPLSLRDDDPGSLLLTWFNFNTGMESNRIHYQMWVKLLIHSQTSMVQPLKFGNGFIISFHTLLSMWLFVHVGIELNSYY